MHCDNCGAAVLPGHRFCRACGRATDDYAEEGTPTQMMPPEPPVRGSRDTATATPSRANTNPVYTPPQQTQQPNYHQQSYAPYSLRSKCRITRRRNLVRRGAG